MPLSFVVEKDLVVFLSEYQVEPQVFLAQHLDGEVADETVALAYGQPEQMVLLLARTG